MPRMKYFQQIANIRNQNLETIRTLSGVYGENLAKLKRQHISNKLFSDIIDEYNAMNYLLGCQYGMTHMNVYYLTNPYTIIEKKEDYIKPSKEMLKSAFIRRLDFINTVLGHLPKSNIGKDIKCVEYYLEKINDNVWYDKLPDKILTYNHKYPNDPILSYREVDQNEEQEDSLDLD